MYITQIMLTSANGGGEETFWMSILIIVLLSSGVGIWALVRRKAGRNNPSEEYAEYDSTVQSTEGMNRHKKTDTIIETLIKQSGGSETGQYSTHSSRKGAVGRRFRKAADLQSGLELLELPFLTGMVGDIESRQHADIEMRKIAFMELVRRGQLCGIEGKALKVYAKNSASSALRSAAGEKGEKGGFGKAIQCEALKELAARTRSEKHAMAVVG
jgi:hypothetical protein